MKKILITGIEGFVSKYLVDVLKNEYEIIGTFYEKNMYESFSHFLDITDSEAVEKIIEKCRPDIIMHLAAQSSGGVSISNPYLTYNVNVMGTINILEAVRKINNEIIFFLPSSSDVYGIPRYLPIDEKHPLNPINPYSSSKMICEEICIQYRNVFDMNIIITRSFNQIGVGQDDRFFMPSIIKQIKNAENGDTIYTGSIDINRDFIDIRDSVNVYKSVINLKNGEYNISSEKSICLRDIVLYIVRLSKKDLKLEVDENRVRKNEPQNIYGSMKLLKDKIEWKRKYDIFETLEWIYKNE